MLSDQVVQAAGGRKPRGQLRPRTPQHVRFRRRPRSLTVEVEEPYRAPGAAIRRDDVDLALAHRFVVADDKGIFLEPGLNPADGQHFPGQENFPSRPRPRTWRTVSKSVSGCIEPAWSMPAPR